MSSLTDSLNQISAWLAENDPESALSFQPGLTCAEIKKMVSHLPFQLPWEFYELYRWKNGAFPGKPAYLFDFILMFPLEELIHYHWFKDKNIFYLPLFSNELAELTGYLMNDYNRGEFSVGFKHSKGVNDKGEEDIVQEFYSNLTKMMLTIAKFYEEGDYSISYDRGYREIICDKEKIHKIYCKYNPEVVAEREASRIYST